MSRLTLLLSALLLLLVGCNGGSEGAFEGGTSEPSESVSLVSLQITPTTKSIRGTASIVILVGESQQFVAMGTYSDGSTKEVTNDVAWQFDSDFVVVGVSGMALGVSAGEANLTAKLDDVVSNALLVTAIDSELLSVQVTPSNISIAKDFTQPLTAIGISSDGITVDITDSVVWTSADTDIASVDTEGTLMGIAEGYTTITASKYGVTSNLVNVEITNTVVVGLQVTSAEVPVGLTQPFTATAYLSDGSLLDVT
ncbi:Ig-like domain-containing protein, partial [Vibrio hyugaensis]|uniref:Ig-like domain-containing protein n=1 Tax=Vibrio hyugaensis TaxID=1534743 RepID=UPI0005EF6322